MGLAQLYVTLNENTKAVNILERSHEKGVMSVESNLLLAYVLKKSDEPKDAFYVLRDANKTFKDERLVYNMALLAEEIEKFQIAVEKYSELPKSSKLYPKALVNLGLLYEKMGEKEKSISTLEEARSVNLVQRDEIDAKLAQLKGYSSKEGRGLAGKPDSMEESNESGKKKK
jgi:tetratricopeptide (TPR) repeat protein